MGHFHVRFTKDIITFESHIFQKNVKKSWQRKNKVLKEIQQIRKVTIFDLQGACGDCEQVVGSSESGLILKMNLKQWKFGAHTLQCNLLLDKAEM